MTVYWYNTGMNQRSCKLNETVNKKYLSLICPLPSELCIELAGTVPGAPFGRHGSGITGKALLLQPADQVPAPHAPVRHVLVGVVIASPSGKPVNKYKLQNNPSKYII